MTTDRREVSEAPAERGDPSATTDGLTGALGIAINVALIALGLWVWDALLLKRYFDRPQIFVLALVGMFALVASATWLARKAHPYRQHRSSRFWTRLGSTELVFLALLLLALLVFHFAFMRAASDGRGYFLQVRSLVIDWNLDFSAEHDAFGSPRPPDNFAFGYPLLSAPFFLAAHLWLGLLNLLGGEYVRNGYFNAYQRAVGLATIFYGFAGLLVVHQAVKRYYRHGIATLTVVVAFLGSFVFWYLAVDSSYSHATSMFAVSLFLYTWDRTRQDRSTRQWGLLGALAGLMTMVRWQNVLFLIVPAGEAIVLYGKSLRAGDHDRALGLVKQHALFTTLAVVAFLPQMLVWRVARGSWFALPASDHPIEWLAPQPHRELFWSDRGLFTWTPLLLFAVIGLLVFTRRHMLVGTLLLAAFGAQIYISSTILSIGHGHGARKFMNCTLIFCLGLAALLDWSRRRPLAAPVLVASTLIVLNAFFMYDLHTTSLQQGGAVSFDRMVRSTTSRLGNPFALPMNLWLAWKYDADLTLYERLGSQTFNNVYIDFGREGDERFLAHGWSNREGSQGASFRWGVGRESSLVVPLKAADVYALRMRCEPFTYGDSPLQVVDVVVNGELAGRAGLQTGLHDYEVIIDPRLLRAGNNEIALRYTYATSPRSLGRSQDPRELAVRFVRLELIRNP